MPESSSSINNLPFNVSLTTQTGASQKRYRPQKVLSGRDVQIIETKPVQGVLALAKAKKSEELSLQGLATHIGKLFGVSVLDLIFSYRITAPLVNRGFCLSRTIPPSYISTLSKLVDLLCGPRLWLEKAFNVTPQQTLILVAPVFEEFQMRFLLQQVILNAIPQKILNYFFSDSQILNSKCFKIARIFITAYLFAILHFEPDTCRHGSISQFVGGLLYATVIESGGSVMDTMVLHIFSNALVSLLFLRA